MAEGTKGRKLPKLEVPTDPGGNDAIEPRKRVKKRRPQQKDINTIPSENLNSNGNNSSTTAAPGGKKKKKSQQQLLPEDGLAVNSNATLKSTNSDGQVEVSV